MDKKEIHYLSYDPDAIWEEMMLRYVEAGGDVLYPGDEKMMLLQSMMADVVQLLAAVDNALRMQTLRYAVGDYLDLLGETRGCSRIEASPARASVLITTNATGYISMLPAGTAMTCDGEMFYLLTEELSLPGYAQDISAEVVADKAGSSGNGLPAGTQMQLVEKNAAVGRIVAATDAHGGSEAESDDSYRERIRESGQASVTTGPKAQYEAASMAVSAEIIDAAAVNEGAGNVGVYLILASGADTPSILQSVEDALSADNVRPLTDTVTVQTADAVTYVLDVEYQAASGVSTAALQEAVNVYQTWQDNSVGQTFDPYRLLALLYQAGATRVQWGQDSEFDGGPIERTEIAATERCLGTITLTELT